MRTRRFLSAFCVALITGLILSACGQKPGVHLSTGQGGQGGGTGGSDLAVGEAGGSDVGGAGSAATGGGTGGAGSGSSTSGGAAAGQAAAAGAGRFKAGPGDRDGISADTIKIGFHAPINGATPAPLTDLFNGASLMENYMKSRKKNVHGRVVKLLVKDDQYNPSHAVAVCRDLVEKEKVFMLVGGGGTDQVIACAQYAASRGVPYLSAGVTENVLKNFPNYFAFSMTYPQQGPLLAQLIKNFDAGPNGGKVLMDRCNDTTQACGTTDQGQTPKVAVVYSDTVGFTDGKQTFVNAIRQQGITPTEIKITKYTISSAEAQTNVINPLKTAGVDVVYILSSPTNWINIMNETGAEGSAAQYRPRWVGVGITMGLDLVATLACGRTPSTYQHSIMLSPWYSVRHPNAGTDEGEFGKAWAEFGDGSDYRGHDLAYAVWGGAVTYSALMNAAGKDITRSKFMATTETLKNSTAAANLGGLGVKDIYPPLSFTASSHFGANQSHVLWAHCEGRSGYWDFFPDELGQFKSGF
jgi:branched-chain amino acid transport system substrate-binding protein